MSNTTQPTKKSIDLTAQQANVLNFFCGKKKGKSYLAKVIKENFNEDLDFIPHFLENLESFTNEIKETQTMSNTTQNSPEVIKIKQVKIINCGTTGQAEEATNAYLKYLAEENYEVLDIKISGQGHKQDWSNETQITVLITYLKTLKPQTTYA